ncbi:hypothetical protein HAALTHF_42160n [Vreelandella aquamarina]|nr:hypothetical protein HAALTHF_42160n [Halomonas axialensis]
MTNNDIFRRIRYTFDLKDNTIVKIFALADVSVTQEQVTAWLKRRGRRLRDHEEQRAGVVFERFHQLQTRQA